MALDLDAYFTRIEYSGTATPTYGVLEALHVAHATHIPFENLDILLGQPIRLDIDSVQAKLVTRRRGGYCFEQNLLFSTVLETIGFEVTRLAARVRYGTTLTLPRTHMLVLVTIGDARWIADVGFGAEGLLMPVPFGDSQLSRQSHWTYRVVPDTAGRWALQSLRGDQWQDLYAFTLEPQEPADYVMANHFTSTHPSSRFVQTLTAQIVSAGARIALRDYDLTRDDGETTSVVRLTDDAEVLRALATTFGLDLPAGSQFVRKLPGDQTRLEHRQRSEPAQR